jgi:hypothetical protein
MYPPHRGRRGFRSAATVAQTAYDDALPLRATLAPASDVTRASRPQPAACFHCDCHAAASPHPGARSQTGDATSSASARQSAAWVLPRLARVVTVAPARRRDRLCHVLRAIAGAAACFQPRLSRNDFVRKSREVPDGQRDIVRASAGAAAGLPPRLSRRGHGCARGVSRHPRTGPLLASATTPHRPPPTRADAGVSQALLLPLRRSPSIPPRRQSRLYRSSNVRSKSWSSLMARAGWE